MTEIFEYVATCLFGLEHFVCEEIDALGYERTEVIDGRVTFRGDISAIARCNLWLRTAERLYLKLGSFSAATFDELFEGTRALPWESWIGKDDCFPVKGPAIKSRHFQPSGLSAHCQKSRSGTLEGRVRDLLVSRGGRNLSNSNFLY